MTKTILALALGLGLAIAVTARAQTLPDPVPPAAPVALPAAIAPVVPATIPLGTRVGLSPSTYDDGNRRDPFASLVVSRARPTGTASSRPVAGLPGLALADVTVRGVVKHGPTFLAILEGPNRQSFVTKVNDRLRDAAVQAIDTMGVTFAEAAGAGTRPATVRKTIRPAGEDIQ